MSFNCLSAIARFLGLFPNACAAEHGVSADCSYIQGMKERAVEHAKGRLEAAKAALREMERGASLKAMTAAWHDLLVAASTVYSKLEQGAKGHGPSEAWFSKKKAERKTDPLLQYVHHARNSTEHSIEDVANASEFSVTMRAGDLQPGQAFGFSHGPNGTLIPTATGDASKMRVRGPSVHLVSVRDRGVLYEPPRTHLGSAVAPYEADDVGRRLLEYLEGMIGEAEGLITPAANA